MGTADREYWKQDGWVGPGRMTGLLTPVVSWLLVLNVAVFFGDLLVLGHGLAAFGAFTIRTGLFGGRLWELVTFQFLHGGIGHVAVNMIGLYFFGPWLERWWGSGRFVVYYLLCGAAGALFYSLLWWVGVFPAIMQDIPLVGASAGLFGILVGVAVIAPEMRVMLVLPPVEMTMRQLALLVLGIAVVAVLTGFGGNAGGEAGHLGGAILGYLLMRRPEWLGWAAGREPDVEIIPPPAFNRRGAVKPRLEVDARTSSEVDRILDKISEHGMHSLTPAERATLDRVSQTRQPPP